MRFLSVQCTLSILAHVYNMGAVSNVFIIVSGSVGGVVLPRQPAPVV